MNALDRLHDDAMALAWEAEMAERKGDFKRAKALNSKAFEKERRVAEEVAGQTDLEPTRAVIHRSAAALALACGETREAERLITRALSGNPHDDVAEELRDLLEDVYAQRHMALRGIELLPNEFQVSFAGKAVGHGYAAVEHIHPRIYGVGALLRRSIERTRGNKFRERGRPKIADVIYQSEARAASYAVTFRIGVNQLELPGMEGAPRFIIDNLLDCLDLVNEGNMEHLRTKIEDDAYFNNFVGLAKKVSPDGDHLNLVGFTATRAQKNRTVALKTAQKNIHISKPDGPETPEEIGTEIRGTLLAADAAGSRSSFIKIVESPQKKHKVHVPRGMMGDIVRPMFEEEVVATVSQKDGKLTLVDIDPA